MKAIFLSILLLILGTASIGAQPVTKEVSQAQRLWEQLIELKGSRQKLHSVSNLLVTKGSSFPDVQQQLYAYPNRYWEWSKGKIVREYIWVQTANLDQSFFQTASDTGILKDRRFASESAGAEYREGWLMDACIFLLETKWAQPTPVSVRRVASLDENQEAYHVDVFEGATKVGGIFVPTKYTAYMPTKKERKLKDFTFIDLKFSFDVDFDPKLFERPPSVAAGPDAWKRKP